jgi:hypothetical protein
MKLCSLKQGAWAGRAAWLAAAALWGSATLAAQTFMLNPLTTSGVDQNGFSIYNVSAFTSYSTVDSRWNQFLESLAAPATLNLPTHSTYSGISGAFGYHQSKLDSWSFSAVYSPSYTYSTYGVSYGSWTHVLALNWQLKLKPRWQLSVSGSGIAGNFQQLLFSPNGSQSLASLASTAAGLASVALTGQGAGASAAISAQEQLFYGDRMFSAALQAGLSYAYSPRLSLGFSASGNRIQHLAETNVPIGEDYYLIPETTNATAGMSMSYMLTPRTSVLGSVTYGRTLSALDHAQYGSSLIGMGRRFSQRWSAEAGAGAGYIAPLGGRSNGIHGLQWQGSGSIAYRGGGHVIVVSAQRSVADFYGLGAAATLNGTLGWGWRPSGARWSVQAGAGESKLLGSQIAALGLGNNGFLANAGMYWSVSHRAMVGLQYAFAYYSGIFPIPGASGPGESLRYAQHSVRLNIGWGMAPTASRNIPVADARQP